MEQHKIDTVEVGKSSVTITCTCGAKVVGSSYRTYYNDLNNREALANFRTHKNEKD